MTERMIAQTTTHGNINPTKHKPLLSLDDCLATPDYRYIQYYLLTGEENLFHADYVLEHLNDAYAKFGEIVLVILGDEINLNDTYAHDAVVELCKKMNTAYSGVFKNTQSFLALHTSYCSVEFEDQTHYYCKHMAEALQEISRVGIDFYNSYGGQ